GGRSARLLPPGHPMTGTPDVSIIIPAYNEEARLERTLRQAVEYFRASERAFELIVVDDGSRDRTSTVARELAAEYSELRLIRLAANRGKGHAVRAGVLNAQGRYVLFADADAATPFQEIERLDAALASGADVAIGSRAGEGSGVRVKKRFYRHIIGRTFHALVSALTVRGIRDTQCGFKLFRGEVAQELFSRMRMNGFSFDVELLLIAQRRRYVIAEVPVNWTHQPGSRVNLMLDPLKMGRDLFIIRSHALRGHYDEPHVQPLMPAGAPRATPESVSSTAPAPR
ncbi:MAG: dolichyl-phosphate beta-glucosyltransferase, partial [Gemmatimonadaceae bacterium]